MAIYRALHKRSDTLALKAHSLDPAAWKGNRTDSLWKPGVRAQMFDLTHSNRMVRFEIIDAHRPCKFIALVRDPIATAVSGFHYNLPSFASDAQAHERADETPVQVMAQHFLERYPHHLTTEWFDLEPKVILGIDVYATLFDHETGYTVLRQGSNEMLVLRAELNDEVKGRVVGDFLQLADVRIGRVNTAHERGRTSWTESLKRQLASHPQYIDSMLNSEYALHFWSHVERAAMRARWLGGDTLGRS